MNRYWDLTREEKAQLGEDDVKALCRVEIMEKGVVDPKPPELLSEEAPTPKTKTVFDVLRKSDYSYQDGESLGFVFETIEQAQTVVDFEPLRVFNDYSTKTRYVKPCHELRVQPREIAEEADVERLRVDLEKAAANKAANEKAKDEYQKQVKAVRDATSGIWEDWHEARGRELELKKIRDTYREYRELCGGDEALARTFLLKAYPREDCAEALPGEDFAENKIVQVIDDSETTPPVE